jgi:hypothetical protein
VQTNTSVPDAGRKNAAHHSGCGRQIGKPESSTRHGRRRESCRCGKHCTLFNANLPRNNTHDSPLCFLQGGRNAFLAACGEGHCAVIDFLLTYDTSLLNSVTKVIRAHDRVASLRLVMQSCAVWQQWSAQSSCLWTSCSCVLVVAQRSAARLAEFCRRDRSHPSEPVGS